MSRLPRENGARPGPWPAARGTTRLLLATALGIFACARFGYETGPLRDTPDASTSAGSGGAAGASGGGSGGAGAGGAGGEPGAGSGGAGGSDAGGEGGSDAGGAGGTTGGAGGSGGTPPPEPTCTDGALNGLETGVDCGGSECAPCACSYAAPQRLNDNINYPGNQVWSPSMMSDNRTLFLAVYVGSGLPEQIASATRPDRRADSFDFAPTLPSPINQAGSNGDGTPHITPNGLALYFYSNRAGGAGDRDLYVATRARTSDNFGNLTRLSALNSASAEHLPRLSADQLTLYFSSNRGGDMDLYRATRSSTGASFSSPTPIAELNTEHEENGLSVTQDGLVVIFSSDRPGGSGDYDLWRAARASTSDPFSAPEPLTALNTPALEADPSLTPDGQEVFFVSGRNGNESLREIFRSLRTCP